MNRLRKLARCIGRVRTARSFSLAHRIVETSLGAIPCGRSELMDDPYLAIQVVMMPRDTNPHGTIFGGVILSYLDQAGAIGGSHEVAKAGGAPPFPATRGINRVACLHPAL